MVLKEWDRTDAYSLTRASLGYLAERATLGWGRFCPPLSNSRTDGRRKTKRRQTKALCKTNLETPKILIKEVSGQVKKLQVSTLLASEPNWRSADRRFHPERVQRLVRRGAVLKTLCKGQGQGQVRSPKVICWTG